MLDDFDTRVRRAKILIVDDNPVNVSLLEEILADAGYVDVRGITDSRKAVPLHVAEEFDLILLDIRMPHLTGIDVLKLLAPLGNDDYVPVLVLTAQTDEETRKEALAAGARDFVTKPFQIWEVLLRIRNMIETRLFFLAQRRRADTLEEEVRRRTAELRDTQVEIVRRLGQAAEYRDNETGAHVMRMSHYCQILALAAGMSPAAAEKLLIVSPMHDIGKIGIPDDILLKPGKLDVDEFDVMKRHALIGYQLLDNHASELLTLARDIAVTHHEKWDGSGYPHGLKGYEIPIEGRIAAIADVFDALTSSRPYKPAWSIERATALIREQSGKHFDPELTRLFLDHLDDVMAIRRRFAEPDDDGAGTGEPRPAPAESGPV